MIPTAPADDTTEACHPLSCQASPMMAPNAPRWLALVNRTDWQMIGLWALVDILVLLGLIVAHATGLLPSRT
jgi:hypothetical protein